MKYLVRDCDPNTGEPDDDGYNDEYVVCEFSKSIHTDGMISGHSSLNVLSPAGRFRGDSR